MNDFCPKLATVFDFERLDSVLIIYIILITLEHTFRGKYVNKW